VKLVVSNLARVFGTRRIFGPLSFTVEPGTAFGVAGMNGSGKTTLVKILAGLLRPSAGTVFFDDGFGTRVAPRDASDRLGWVAPDLSLYSELTAAENLSFFAKLHGRPTAAEAVAGLLETVGLDPARVASTPIRSLSTGQRQRLKLAYATLHEPAVLLLDEPSSNLDEAGRGVVERVVAAQKERGIAVVASNDPRDLSLAGERLTL
jgi:heme exporter protein A